MIIAGIETSCDESAVAILEIIGDKVAVLSNVISSQIAIHAEFGGVVPAIAAREHIKNLPIVWNEAIIQADNPKIDAIAVTAGPGLISSLLVGTTFAQTKSYLLNIPLIGVNHIEGHILSPILSASNISSINFPAICLTVSGGHTQITKINNTGDYELIGETLDDAAGECFDKIARLLELGYPGGPAISKEALEFNSDTNPVKITLPRPMQHSHDYNFSFSGLKTAVLYLVRDIKDKFKFEDIQSAVAYESQEAITDVLTQKTIKCAIENGISTVMLAGGVSANSRLREKFKQSAQKNNLNLFIPELKFTTDNASMIALAGYMKYINLADKQNFNWQNIQVDANDRIC